MPIEKETPHKIEENVRQNETIDIEKLFKSLSEMPSDFYAETRVDEPPQERKANKLEIKRISACRRTASRKLAQQIAVNPPKFPFEIILCLNAIINCRNDQ